LRNFENEKMNISLDDDVYQRLFALDGEDKISQLLNKLARSYIAQRYLIKSSQALTADEEAEVESQEQINLHFAIENKRTCSNDP